MATSQISSATLVTQDVVQAVCGDVTPMTIWRWRHDPELNFPKPLAIRNRLYWREREVIAWLDSREVADASAA
jgi:predicted DNA-binding transcriptional regulator AlpA